MVKLRDKLLPVFDKVARGIPNKLGLRQYDVTLRIVSWSGARPGLGVKTVVNHDITVNQAKPDNDRPKVKLLTTRDIIASGGRYTEGDYRIGPLTPQYTKNGITYGTVPEDIEQQIQVSPQEIYFNLKGPGMSDPVGGDWFSLLSSDFSKNFGYNFVVRKTASIPT